MSVSVVVTCETVVVVVVRVTFSFLGPEATTTATATPSPSASAARTISAILVRSKPPPPSSSSLPSLGVGGTKGPGGPPLSASTRRGSGGGGGSSGEDISHHVNGGLHLVFADHERRQEAKHPGAGNVYHQAAVQGPAGDVAGIGPLDKRDAHHEAAPADLGHAVEIVEERHEPAPQLARSPQQRGVVDELHCRQRGGGRDRCAGEGGPVVAGFQHVAPLRRGDAGAHRQATAEGLGRRHDVGPDRELLIGPQRPGSTHAGLDLVEDEQGPGLV